MTHTRRNMKHARRKISILAPRSTFYKGPFGRIFPDLPPWRPIAIDPEDLDDNFDAIRDHLLDIVQNEMTGEANIDSRIPAGYTYFGQFIDHDVTFDPVSSLMRENDPSGILNHRTPRLDLDNLYGRGRSDSPYLYRSDDRDLFLTGNVINADGDQLQLADLPRNSEGTALIGDPRNDENVIVSQLHLAFLLAHNTLVGRARDMNHPDPFNAARRTLRWLYQYIVWNDFVRRIANDQIHSCALQLERTCPDLELVDWTLGLDGIYEWKEQPFMPVEFSVAAYRFGHTMVRDRYQTNQPFRGFDNFVPIFGGNGGGLIGGRPVSAENYIQWDWFLQMESSSGPFPQLARKIDTNISGPLLDSIPTSNANPLFRNLAFRNLLRGFRFGLPSGTDVARRLGVTPIPIDNGLDSLWFYILNEAENLPGNNQGEMLGRVGSYIVCATFAGLLRGDPHSFYNVQPTWTPDQDALLMPEDRSRDSGEEWTLASIIRLSGLPVSAADF